MSSKIAVIAGAHGLQSPDFGERGIARYIQDHLFSLLDTGGELIKRVDLDESWTVPSSYPRLLQRTNVSRGSARPAQLPDLYHVMSPFEDVPIQRIWPVWAQQAGVRLVVTVYDLIPLLFPRNYLTGPNRHRYLARLELLRKADALVTISEASREDLIRLLHLDPERVVNISASCGPSFARATQPSAEILRELQGDFPTLESGFILYTGGFDFRKNFDGLMEAYGQVPEDVRAKHQLVITCKAWPAAEQELKARAAKLGFADRLLLTGFVSDENLVKLYQTCGLFVFPSLYEGFGLPILEASRCGAPVIASNTSSMRELVLEEQAQFNPWSSTSIRDCIVRAVREPKGREELCLRGQQRGQLFSWEKVAQKTVEAYRMAVQQRPKGQAPKPKAKRFRLACFSPMPPEASGIADYSARLFQELVEHCDIDVFVSSSRLNFALPSRPGIRIQSAQLFDSAHGVRPYDRILHCMGNSHFHAYAWPYLQRYRGDVLAHELRMTGFFWDLDRSPAALADRVSRQYGDLVPRSVREDVAQLVNPMICQKYALYLSGDLLAKADRLFVHSTFAQQVAAQEGRPDAIVLPFGHPGPAPAPAWRGPATVTTFGIVSETKHATLMMRGFAQAAKRVPGVRFVFAGEFDHEVHARLLKESRALEIQDRVLLTGRLSDGEYQQWLGRTTVAIQLRAASNGECSAAIADCLSAGLPTVVSRIGAFADIPADVVTHVGEDVSPGGLGNALTELLLEPARRDRQRSRALAYAEENSFSSSAALLWQHLQRSEELTLRPAQRRGLSLVG